MVAVPTLLRGKYLQVRRLGGGGMAEVFLARTVGAEGFSRDVALKRVISGYSQNPNFAKMFISEATLSSRLRHPNIVSVLDFDRDEDGAFFLVMELVEGRDLDALMDTGRLPLPVILYVIREVLRGLGYAHELPFGMDGVRGMVHRDVSPHNVLLSWEGEVKVSDFGIAKAREASEVTASILIKGKPAYMSPEQASGEPLDGGSDLFAVGVMMWEMLCGMSLFGGESTQETLSRVLFGEIPSARMYRPDLPAEVEGIVTRLLMRDRPLRYPNAEAAITDLIACDDYPTDGRELLVDLLAERFAGQAPRRARSIPSLGPTDATSVGPPFSPTKPATVPMRLGASTTRTAVPPERARSRRVLALLVVLAVIASVAVAAVVWNRRDAAHTPAVVAPSLGSGSSTPANPQPQAAHEITHAMASGPLTGQQTAEIPATSTVRPPQRPPPEPKPLKPAPGSADTIREITVGGG